MSSPSSESSATSMASSPSSRSDGSSRKRKRNDPEDQEESESEDDRPSPPRAPAPPSRVRLAKDASAALKRKALSKTTTKTTGSDSIGSSSLDGTGKATAAVAESSTAPVTATRPTFDSLGVRPWLVRSLANLAIRRPTKIQAECIPHIMQGRDCIGVSKTGSGKTVAFAVPILQELWKDPSAIFALVLTPGRELAVQIYEQFEAVSAPHNLRALIVTGGRDMMTEAINIAKKPHVIIATPGRLLDHMRSSGEDTMCGLKRLKFLVLDEADRLLDSRGNAAMFRDVKAVIDELPPATQRQTLFFTATVTPQLRFLKDNPPQPGKKPPVLCEVDTQKLAVPATLKQTYVQVQTTHREHYLHAFLLTKGNVDKSVIVFCNLKKTAQLVHHMLHHLEHRVTSLHSNLPQRQRTDNLCRFRAGAARILVATDVASRGLDIPEVNIVVNFDVPGDPDDYIHRVGRTARAGRSGEAVTFVGRREVDRIHAIEKRVGEELQAWKEEGVNLETRVVRDYLNLVSEKRTAALMEVEEGSEVGGRRKRQKVKLRPTD